MQFLHNAIHVFDIFMGCIGLGVMIGTVTAVAVTVYHWIRGII